MYTQTRLFVYPFLAIGFLFALNSCHKSEGDNPGPAASKVPTTLERTIVVDAVTTPVTGIKSWEVSKFLENGYGKWHYGPGLASDKRLDLMPAGYTKTSATNAAKLLRFFALTDIHITDKESPAQVIFYANSQSPFSISCYSPTMLYTTHVLDATVKTVNQINKQNPIDFGIALGDLINSSQYNEIRWFIDVLDGKPINPDSGIKDDPVTGPNNDYQDPFQATGLDKSIPWYVTMGNHDHFWMGSKPPTTRILNAYTGSDILQLGNILDLKNPNAINETTYSMGTLNGATQYGAIIGSGVVATMPKPIATVSADPNRRFILRSEWMNEFFNSTSNPSGHGFNRADASAGFACYSFEPKSSIPVKVIVLDDTQNDTDISDDIYGHGSLDQRRYDWLLAQLQEGQDHGKLMIIAAHVPIGVAPGEEVGWYKDAVVTEDALIAKLKSYPNLILWIAGHRHLNTVKALPSTDPAHPELGFWQVETKSLREFPQQFRTFDIVRNSDNTISILTTNIDPEVEEGSFAAISRTCAIAANQIYGINDQLLPTGSVSYNAELVKQLSPEMQTKIKNYGTAISK